MQVKWILASNYIGIGAYIGNLLRRGLLLLDLTFVWLDAVA